MPLPDDHLAYPQRRYGMDHARYGWSELVDRPAVSWPGGAPVALWVMPILQWFPLDSSGKPFRAPGALTMPYPDYRHYTQRDYGNRVGIYRILDVLDELEIKGSVAANAAVAERYPGLVRDVVAAGHEIVAHGLDMDHLHHGGLSVADESALVARSLETLRRVSGQPVTGWLSPGRSQSAATPDILAAHGVLWSCDWAHDDMPVRMQVASGQHWTMPLAQETDDRAVLLDFHHSEDSFRDQLVDRFACLAAEAKATGGGRIMSVPLHAWVAGVPHRIGLVREALAAILAQGPVWSAGGSQVLDAFRGQEGRDG